MVYKATPYSVGTPALDVTEFKIFVQSPFLGHHYYILSLSDLCLGVEKIFFKKQYIDTT